MIGARHHGAAVLGVAMAIVVAIAGLLLPNQHEAEAADISGWDPGYIISDELFYNGNAMTVNDVQWFLNSTGPACASGYICLKSYATTTQSRAANAMCGAYDGGGVESAAAIITKVGSACGISQQVLLVLLQKEQSLVTSSAPSNGRYQAATGYACPDTAGCDSEYYGFFNQVYWAAWQYKRYANPPGTSKYFTWFPVGVPSEIRYNPNIYCFSSTVTIRNKATAALYYYTPYQPNQAALDNLYGTGNECSAYGNRNFWRIFSDWFGSPNGSEVAFVKSLYQDTLGRDVDADGLTFWVARLRGGLSRIDVANAVLSSTEYRTLKVNQVYADFLNRAPDPDGMAFWMAALGRGAIRTDQLNGAFLSSQEFFDNLNDSEPAFITAMYEHLLGREPTLDDIVYYSGDPSVQGRTTTIDSIYRSPESVGIRVEAMFQKYLGMSANWTNDNFWLRPVQTSGDPAMLRGIFISADYDQRARARFPDAG